MNFGFECFRKLFCCFPKIYGWGVNSAGELGNASPVSTPAYEGFEYKSDMPLVGTEAPTIDNQSDWVKVCSADGIRGYGILADGSMWGWGPSLNGTPSVAGSGVGDGTSETRTHPVQIGVGHKWKDVSGSASHALAIREDDTLWAWGSNRIYYVPSPVSGAIGTHLVYLRNAPSPAEEAVRAVLSRPIASTGMTKIRGGKYSEKPSAEIRQMTRASGSSPWTQSSVLENATAEAVMNYEIKSVEVTNGGSGYTSTPSVTLEEDGAAVAPSDRNLAVARVHVTAEGSGYKTPPGVRFIGQSSSTASATVTKMTCRMKSLQLTSGGSGYTNPPRVEATDLLGVPREIGTATISNGAVTGVTLKTFLFHYWLPGRYAVTFTGYGSGASATVEVEGAGVQEVTLASGGDGYKEPPQVEFVPTDGGSGATADALMVSLDRVGAGNAVLTPTVLFKATKVRVTNGGSGYTSRPTVTMPAPLAGGTRASATVSKMGCLVESVNVTAPGGGYSAAPTVTLNGRPAEGLSAVLENGTVVGVDVAPGLMIDAEEAVVGFSGGGGSGATAAAVLRLNHVIEVDVQSPGEYPIGYAFSGTLAVSFSGVGAGATAVAEFGEGVVQSVSVALSPKADGYREKPRVVFSGGGGTGAEAVAKVEGQVESVEIKSVGDGYTLSESPLPSRSPFVFFSRAEGDEFADGSLAWGPSQPEVGENEALFSCRIEPGPVHSLVISDAYNGQSPPENDPSPPFSKQGDGRVAVQDANAEWHPEGSMLVLGQRQENLPLSQDSLGWEYPPWVVSPQGGGWVTSPNRVPLKSGPPSPVPVWNLNFISSSGADAAGTISTPNGWATVAVLSNAGIGYASEPVVEIDGADGTFKQPVQIGEGRTWKAVSAGDKYSLGIAGDGFPYWWGRVPAINLNFPSYFGEYNITQAIVRPERVGKRLYIAATPKDEESPPLGSSGWVAPPIVSAGRPALVSYMDRQLKRPFFAGHDPVNPLKTQYEGPYVVVMGDGTGYTELPELRFGASAPFTATASLVGPDSCRSVVAAGSLAFAIDDAGALWHLNASAATHGDTFPTKFRLFLRSYSTQAQTREIAVGAEHVDDVMLLGGLGVAPSSQRSSYRLSNGGTGAPYNSKIRWSGDSFVWYIVKHTNTSGFVGGVFQTTYSEQIHSSGEIASPDYLRDLDVWRGSASSPAWTYTPASYYVSPYYSAPNNLGPPYPPVPPNEQGGNIYYRLWVFRKSSYSPNPEWGVQYEKLPNKLRHRCFGPAKIGSQHQWEEVTRDRIGRTTDGKLFHGVGEPFGRIGAGIYPEGAGSHGLDIPGNPFPEAMQFPQLRVGGQSGVKEADQSLWLLGDPQYGPPVVKGDIELKIEDAGSGYTEPAILTFSSQPAGVATASATLNGSVISIGITNKGSGYRSPPNVVLSGGGGAQCEAVIAGPVDSVQITSGGSAYRTPPRVRFSQPGISAKATATIKDGAVDEVFISDGGRYRAAPDVFFDPVPDVESISVTSGGSGYSSPPSVLVTGGSGSGCAATCSIDGRVTEVTLASPGVGYKSPPEVTFVGGGGQGATAIAGLDEATGGVSGITILSPGSGYQSPPSVVISGGEGNGALAIASIAGPVRDVTIMSRGTGYDRPPQVFFQGGGGTGATAEAATAAPGIGAAGTCKISGSVIYCKVINGGSGYGGTPDVSFTGGENESLSALELQLARGEITQDEFDQSVTQFRASGQARIKGGLALAVENGGERYAWRRSSELYWTVPSWERWNNGLPYWRDGDMMSPRFWVHVGGGRSDQTIPANYTGVSGAYILAPGLTSATTSTNERPGGAIVSMQRPDTNAAVDTGTHWTQRPLVSFWNTHAIRSQTSLRLEAMARRTGGTAVAKPIYTWPHSLQYLGSLLNSSLADVNLSGPNRTLLGFLLREAGGLGFDVPTTGVAEFASGGTIVSAYLDGVVSSEVPFYGSQQETAKVSPVGYSSGLRYKFETPPTVSVECDIGTGASVVVNVDGEGGGTVSVASGGSGYGSLARTVVSGGRPKITPATATASILNGAVVSASVTDQGGGYTSPPAVVIHGGGGSGAAGIAILSSDDPFYTIRRRVVSVVITSPGSGYTSPPTISLVETDKDYADFASTAYGNFGSPWSWLHAYGYSEPAGYRARLVGLTGTKPEYFEMLAGEKSKRVALSSILPSVTTDDEVSAFFADGYIVSATLDSSHSDMERHPSLLKQLPANATVIVRGKCDSTASISITRPKWSNEMHGTSGTTFAVRDTTQ